MTDQEAHGIAVIFRPKDIAPGLRAMSPLLLVGKDYRNTLAVDFRDFSATSPDYTVFSDEVFYVVKGISRATVNCEVIECFTGNVIWLSKGTNCNIAATYVAHSSSLPRSIGVKPTV